MRIVYVAHINDGSGSGVVHKMAAQAAFWRSAGHEVRFVVATRDRTIDWGDRLGDRVMGVYDGWRSRFRTMDRLARAASRYRPHVVYMRYDLFYPSMWWLARRACWVVEVNTDDLQEYDLGSRKRALYNARMRGFILRRANAVVFVTGELSRSRSFAVVRGRREVISNGVDLDAYPELPAPSGRRPRLVFVGSLEQPWQGTDKVIRLASATQEWDYDVVGGGSQQGALPPNVTWHGQLERRDVLQVLAQADVGIGTLALHRKAMNEACPLKVREYLAVGLPVLYACEDPDVDRLGDVALRIANTETNVVDELSRIQAFVQQMSGRRAPRSAIRHLDVTTKEQQRMALLEAIAAQ